MKLNINSEFQKLLWPLTADEYKSLEQQLTKDGCRDSIVCWNGTIVDGHNRYNICNANSLTFTTSSIAFSSAEEAKDWIDKNQTGRRNVTPEQLSVIRGRLYNRTKSVGHGKKSECQIDTQNTARRLANEFGVSERTINRDAKFAKEVESSPELQEAIKKKVPVKKAKNEIYKKEEAKKKDVSAVEITSDDCKLFNCDILAAPIEDNSIDVIITDPPYPREYLDCWKKLAEFANAKLKDGGILLAMSGQSYLPEVYDKMEVQGLNYYWTGCIYTPGTSANLNTKRLRTNWKPLLIYVKGEYTRTFQGSDVYTSEYKDTAQGQAFHKWGQSYPVFYKIVQDWTYAKDVICDPFLGGGTTALACINNKRQFRGIEIDSKTYAVTSNRIQAL